MRPGAQAWGDVHRMETYLDIDKLALCDPFVVQVCFQFGWIEKRTLWRNGEDIAQFHVVRVGDNESSDRARFIEAYDQLAQQVRKEQQAPLLAIARDLRERGQLSSAGDLVAGLLATAKDPK